MKNIVHPNESGSFSRAELARIFPLDIDSGPLPGPAYSRPHSRPSRFSRWWKEVKRRALAVKYAIKGEIDLDSY